MNDSNKSQRVSTKRRGFTILELLVTFSIIGLLVGLLLPAVQAAREKSRRAQCQSHLNQLGLALHGYHETNGSFPAAWQWQRPMESAYGWNTALLPFLKQKPLFDRLDRTLPLADDRNQQARLTSLPPLLCPSDITEQTFELFAEDVAILSPLVTLPTASYLGVFGTIEADDLPIPTGDGTFWGCHPTQITDLQRGLSQTAIVGERPMARVPSTWLGVDFRGEDAACRIVGNAELGPNHPDADECEFGSRHPGQANFLWADGSVRAVSDNVDNKVYHQFTQRCAD